jgi:hypothetical protein
MIQDIDIYRTANVIITQYGEHALLEAMSRIERYRAFGNDSGMRVWERIADAIEWMQMPASLSAETVVQ